MGIDLGHGVHDARRASSFSTCLARRRGAQQACQEGAPRAEAGGQAERCAMVLIRGPSLACFTARVMARHRF